MLRQPSRLSPVDSCEAIGWDASLVQTAAQPILPCQGGGPLGFELLARMAGSEGGPFGWPHPPVLPREWLSLDQAVLSQIPVWRSIVGPGHAWFVNLAPSIPRCPDLFREYLPELRRVIDWISPDPVVVEISEGHDPDREALSILVSAIRSTGAEVALDDYSPDKGGEGVLNIALWWLIKADCSNDCPVPTGDGFWLAEQVEDPALLPWLRGQGYNYVQGFATGAPRILSCY